MQRRQVGNEPSPRWFAARLGSVGLVLALTIPVDARAESPVRSSVAETLQASNRRLSDDAELDRIVDLYLSGQYDKCYVALDAALTRDGAHRFIQAEVIEKGWLYAATCAYLAGDEGRAQVSLKRALEHNPLMAPPDSLTFPPPIINLFFQARDEMQTVIAKREQEEIQRLRAEHQAAQKRELAREKREAELERLATEETVVRRSERVVAFVPLGAGQYQNGARALGDFFLVTELVLGAATIASSLVLLDLQSQALDLYAQGSRPGSGDNSSFQAAYTVLNVSAWSLLGVTLAGILEANLSFQPERVIGTRPRPLPPLVKAPGATSLESPVTHGLGVTLYPIWSACEGGGVFGVRGSF